MLAKLCEECTSYISGGCEGKDENEHKVHGKPCKNYLFATEESLRELDKGSDVEPTDEQLDSIESEQVIPTGTKIALADNSIAAAIWGKPAKITKNVKGGAKSLEQRQADFQRLSVARANRVIASIKLLGNLVDNPYAYACTPEDVKALRTTLEETVHETLGRY